MIKWTTNHLPDLHGYTTIVTGANSGLGLETARAMAAKGAHIILACRNTEKARKAEEEIRAQYPDASLELATLDLASLASIREFAAGFTSQHTSLHVLFNNAGVMAIPRRETADGFEMQFGTNHLGHFALTGLLLPTLLATPKSRIVTLSSIARRMGDINFDDLQGQQAYDRWRAYGQSKRANLLFAFELQRRLVAAGAETISVAAHPGYSNTELQTTSIALTGDSKDGNRERFFYNLLGNRIGQSAAMGALPQLYAAFSQNIHGGELVGPHFLGLRGYPKIETNAQKEYKQSIAQHLWDDSIRLTGIDYAELHSQKATLA